MSGGPPPPVDFYIIGLGNPEVLAPRFSRHNLGAIFVNFLACALRDLRQLPGPPVFYRCAGLQADILDTTLPALPPTGKPSDGSASLARPLRLVLVKPVTAMNTSGESVAKVLRHFEGDGGPAAGALSAVAAKCLVFCDDLNSPVGALTIQVGGELRSLAGHHGVESVAQALGTTEFPRFRLGIGRPPPDWTVQRFVLTEFMDQRELDLVGLGLRAAIDALQHFARSMDLKATRKKFTTRKVPNNLKRMASLDFPVTFHCA